MLSHSYSLELKVFTILFPSFYLDNCMKIKLLVDTANLLQMSVFRAYKSGISRSIFNGRASIMAKKLIKCFSSYFVEYHCCKEACLAIASVSFLQWFSTSNCTLSKLIKVNFSYNILAIIVHTVV